MKTSSVKEVVVGNSYEGKYGTMINHTYTMEDGTVIQASHKKASPIAVGETVEYEIIRTDEKYGHSGKVSKPKPAFGGGGGGKYSSVGQVVGMSLNNATLAYCHGKIEEKDIASFADRIVKAAKALQSKYDGQF